MTKNILRDALGDLEHCAMGFMSDPGPHTERRLNEAREAVLRIAEATETQTLLNVAQWICQDDQVSLGPKCCGKTVVKPCAGCPHVVGKNPS